jgi:hypothetical protein
VDEHTISPAGDPFHAAPRNQDHPHACLNGYIYLGYTAVDEETGEEVDRVEALPCRRCAEEARWVIGSSYPSFYVPAFILVLDTIISP